MNVENILAVASHIENLPNPKDFDMCNETHPCGSPSCFLGWINHIASKGERRGFALGSMSNAMKFTDVDQITLVKLCYPTLSSSIEKQSINPYIINNKQGAKVLRHLAETGEVDFSVAKEVDTCMKEI